MPTYKSLQQNTGSNLYVKNPNYNPLDQRSNRYVSDTQAQEEATKKATSINDIFSPFTTLAAGVFKPYNANNFYTPLPANARVTGAQTNTAVAGAPLQMPTGTGTGIPYAPAKQPAQAAGIPTAQPAPTIAAGVTAQQLGVPNTPPAGWDAQTYANFKAANPALEPDAQDTARMLEATPSGALNPDEIARLAKQAGTAGLSTDQFISILQANAAPSASAVDEIRTKLGIPNLVDEAFRKPEKTTIDQYKELYDLAGLRDIQSKISTIDESINKKRADLVAATGEINNNPWVSQATRAGRLKNLQELAYADINNDIERKNQMLDLYDKGVDEVERQVGLITADRTEARTLTVDQLNYALNEAERLQKSAEGESITAGLRNVPDYLQGLLQREQTQQSRELALKAGTGGGLGGAGGVSPLALEVLAAPELLSSFTPTERGKLITQLVNAGYDVSGIAAPQISAAGREQIAQYDDLVRQGQMAETILDEGNINTGILSSRISALGTVAGLAQDYTRYRGVIDNMGSALLKLRSGAAVTPQEFERIRGFIPAVTDSEATAKTKITAFYQELATAQQNYIRRQTQTTQQIRQGAGLTGGDATDDYLSNQGL